MGRLLWQRLIVAGLLLAAGAGFLMGRDEGLNAVQWTGVALAFVMALWWIGTGRGKTR